VPATSKTIVRAYTANHYHKDILVIDEDQVQMSDVRVRDTLDGIAIFPEDFPEMTRFVVLVQPYRR